MVAKDLEKYSECHYIAGDGLLFWFDLSRGKALQSGGWSPWWE
jgi:hypothetical protein